VIQVLRELYLPCYAIALNSYRETIRNKVIASLVVFSLILMVIGTLMGEMSLHHEVRVATNVGLCMTTVLGVIMGIYASITLLHTEFERRTIYTLLSKPIHRWQFLIGKLVGVTGLCFTAVSILGAVSGILVVMQGGTIGLVFLMAFLMAFLQAFIVAALSILFASFTGGLLAGVCAFSMFIAGSMMSQIEVAQSFFEEVSPLAVPFIRALTFVLPNIEALSLTTEMTYGVLVPWSYALNAMWYAISYVVVTMLLAIAIFRRRELQ